MAARNTNLDLIRLLACFFVIFMHSPYPNIGTPGIILSGISYITAPCIGLFFMVSGALLIKTENFDTKLFLKKRFAKILFPTLLWSIVGYCLFYLGISNDENAILWFMYCLVGLYLLTPILSRWLSHANRSELEFYLCIWLISLLIPFAKLLTYINESDTSWIYYFHGYVGYYVLGYYLNNYELEGWRNNVIGIAFIVLSILSPILLLTTGIEFDFYSLFWYLSITVALCCIVWWKVCHRIKKVPGFVSSLSKLSFGVYLVHILIMRNVIWVLGEPYWIRCGGVLQIMITFVLTTILSFLIAWMISKTKLSKYIIGI